MLMPIFRTFLLSATLTGFLFTQTTSAEKINDDSWLVKPGDSIYKIARTLYPGDLQKQADFRKQIIELNPHAFSQGTATISTGVRLKLPQTEPLNTAPRKSVSHHSNTIKDTTKKISTPDPADEVGQVIVSVGTLQAENRGDARQLKRRSRIYRGDTLSTGNNGHTQVRMKDGALISLRPNSSLKIEDFRYQGKEDGSELSLLELIKGGFRTITGAIGHRNKKNYRVKTAVATIGIRGTHYSLMLCQQQSCSDSDNGQVDDGLYGGVTDGSIVIENESGIHQFNNDQFFRLTSSSEKPVEFLQPPSILRQKPKIVDTLQSPTNETKEKLQQLADTVQQTLRRRAVILEVNETIETIQEEVLQVLDQNTSSTQISNLQPSLAPDNSAMLIGFHYSDVQLGLTGVAAPVIVTANNDNEIYLINFTLPDGNVIGNIPIGATEFSFDPELLKDIEHNLIMASPLGEFTATLVPSSLGGSSIGVNWGRWNGDFTVLKDGQPLLTGNNFHFIYSDKLTSPTQLATLGGLIGSATYNISGGTLPTDHLDNVATNLPSISMSVDFQTGIMLNYDISLNIAGNAYSASATDISLQNISDSFTIQSLTTAACPSGAACVGEASILFVGDQAQGAMNSYLIEDALGTSVVTGSAFLTQGAAQ